MSDLALIAGRGALPAALLDALPERPLVAVLSGQEPEGLRPDMTFRLEELGSFIAQITRSGVRRVCMAGAIERPVIDPAAIDAATLPLLPVLQRALMQGDDGALRAAIAVFEAAKLDVVAAHHIAPDLLPPAGILTAVGPDAGQRADAERGCEVLRAMAAADTGQACAVHDTQVIALEAAYGTDWMLSSLAQRPDAGGGVLVKTPKVGQDRRADLPVIGPVTIDGCRRAGLRGLMIGAGGVMVLHQAQVIAAADAAGIAIWVQEPV